MEVVHRPGARGVPNPWSSRADHKTMLNRNWVMAKKIYERWYLHSLGIYRSYIFSWNAMAFTPFFT